MKNMTTEEFNEFLECEGVIYFEGNKRGNFKQWQELAKDYDLELTGSPNDFKVEVRNPVSIETFIERYNLEHEDSKMYQEEYTVDELKDLLMSQPTEFSPTEINAEKEEFPFSLNESIKILTKSGRFPDLVKELNEMRKPKIKGEYISISIEQAFKVLIKALKEDPAYFYSWQANIALQFKDLVEYKSIHGFGSMDNRKSEKVAVLNKEQIHELANQAAINFLNLLTYERS